MKFFVFFFIINLLSHWQLFSQKDDFYNLHKIVYTNTNNLEILINRKSGFSNDGNSENKGFGIELNSFHGAYLLKRISLTVGIGIAFNIKEDFKALPVVGQIKYHLYPYDEDGPFILLNTGRNIKMGSFTSGGSSKLGLGYVFESDAYYRYVIGVFLKSKEYLLNKETNFNYQTESLGLSVGFQF